MMTKSMAAALLFFSATSTESISLPGQYSLTMSWQAEISGKYYPYEKNCFYDIDGQQYLEKSQGSVTLELPYTGKAYSFSASGGWCNSWAFTSKIGPFPSMVGLTWRHPNTLVVFCVTSLPMLINRIANTFTTLG